METGNSGKVNHDPAPGGKPHEKSVIKVRAKIYCKECGFEKSFRNQFTRENIELIVVTFKILDFMTCPKCTEMLSTDFEYEIP